MRSRSFPSRRFSLPGLFSKHVLDDRQHDGGEFSSAIRPAARNALAMVPAVRFARRASQASRATVVAAVVALAATIVLPGCAAEQPPDTSPRKIEVLFLGHDSQHHDSARSAPILASAVAPEGINISYTSDPADLNPEELALYDALIVYANHNEITESQERALLDFVASGNGFLPLHSASFCFRNSDAYVELVGAQFSEHGTGTFTAELVAPDHPILEGLEPFETWDETYVHVRHNPDRTVLMERVEEGHREPYTWVRTHGEGRVFYTALGHDQRTWEHPGFLRLVRNGIVWAVADDVRARWEGLELEPLSWTEPPVPVPNYERRPEALPLQEPLSPGASLAHTQVPPGFEIELFASEPDIVNPIATAWDERGRMWVLETVDYPNDKQPLWEGNDRLTIVEDTDGDGRADSFKVFADGLSIPTSLVFWNGGVIVSQAPEFLYLADTDGDDVADVREVLMSNWGVRDTHAGPSNLKYGLDNWIWGTVGYSGYRGEIGGERFRFGQAVYRFRPEPLELEVMSYFTNNTWGLGFTEAFDVFGSTANNEHSVYVSIPAPYYEGVEGLTGTGRRKIDGHYAMRPITRNIRQVDSQGGFTAAAGHNFYTARAFPEEYWNRVALVNEPTGNLLHRAIIERDGSGYAERDGWNLAASPDEWASPVHAEVGPDGAVWVLDWYAFIVQHNPTPEGFETGRGAAYETPLRDYHQGRIWRLSWKDAPEAEPMTLTKDRPRELVAALESDNMFWRTTAQRLLVERSETDVLPQLYRLVERRRPDELGLDSPALHALWTIHGLGALGSGTVEGGGPAGQPGSTGAGGGPTGVTAAGGGAAPTTPADPEALRVARRALTHPAAGVRKAAMHVLPKDESTLAAIAEAGLLADPDLNVRKEAFLVVSKLPASAEIGRVLYEQSELDEVRQDEWLPEALFIAAARHRQGFLDAYAADIGVTEFTTLATRYARGELVDVVDWSAPALDDSDWRPIQVPSLWRETPLGQFDGAVWFRRELELPAAAAAGRTATLRLGPVNDSDRTYVNGVLVGETPDAVDDVREYAVPAGVLRAGRNVIAVRVLDQIGRGGIWGDPGGVYLEAGSQRHPLAGRWRHQVEEEYVAGKRREIRPDVPIAQQFLRVYNPVAGVLETPAPNAALETDGDDSDVYTLALAVVAGENRYDKNLLTVRAGQRVRLVFDNTDDMRHNVLIVEPGSLEEIGARVDAMLEDPEAEQYGYIPSSDVILYGLQLVEARESAVLDFRAPSTPGDYPYVCTFPGHWRTMQGVLRVVG